MAGLTVSFWLKGTKGGMPLSRLQTGVSAGFCASGDSDNCWYEGNGSWNTPAFGWVEVDELIVLMVDGLVDGLIPTPPLSSEA